MASPVQGHLRVMVLRAMDLRLDNTNEQPDAFIKMRILLNRKVANAPKRTTTIAKGTRDPEYNQEFFLPVIDATVSQLEVTLWDARFENDPNAGFLGECILNLSKLVPYAGNIIEQDFDVKQGKHFKTENAASGKLMLQLEFSTDPLPEGGGAEDFESADAMQGTPAKAPPPQEQQEQQQLPQPGQAPEFMLNISAMEAKGLGVGVEAYACVSAIDDPASMQGAHFLALDHDLQDPLHTPPPDRLRVPPLHFSPVARSTLDEGQPKWEDATTIRAILPSILSLEAADRQGQLASVKGSANLEGKPLLLMVTVHDLAAQAAGKPSNLGRVILPQIVPGPPVDQWFVLQAQNGAQILDPQGVPTGVRLRILYCPTTAVPPANAPNPFPPAISHAPSPPPHTSSPPQMPPTVEAAPPAAQTPSAQEPPPPSVPAPAVQEQGSRTSPPPEAESAPGEGRATGEDVLFAFHLEVVEARNLTTASRGVVGAPFACVSLLGEPEGLEKRHFFLIDHQVGGQDGGDPQSILMQPLAKTGAVPSLPHGGASWGSASTLRSCHPHVVTLEQGGEAPLVPLAGAPVLLLATVHDASAPGGAGFAGRMLIPQVKAGQPVDQWFMLQGRDGVQLKNAAGESSAIRLRFAYGALRASAPTSITSPPPSSQPAPADPVSVPLPPGWDKKLDPSGKVFYVNHALRTFSWTPPPAPPPAGSPHPSDTAAAGRADRSSPAKEASPVPDRAPSGGSGGATAAAAA
ncbi:hypothetical protein T484DRAFT_1906846, partial [Baffinella frigidus]